MVDLPPEEPLSASTRPEQASASSAQQIAVCPISRHPGFIATLERLLGGEQFKLCPMRLESNLDRRPRLVRGKPHPQPLPSASVFVLDLSSTNMETGALIERIRSEQPQARMVMVKESAEDDKIFPFLRMGVRGIVRYADAETQLARAVRAVEEGDLWVQRKQVARFIDWLLTNPAYRGTLNEPGMLSPREREVLVSVLSGLTNKEIASTLNISERTVKFHVSHLLQKLGASRRSDLIAKQFKIWPAIS